MSPTSGCEFNAVCPGGPSPPLATPSNPLIHPKTLQTGWRHHALWQQVMPDDHSEVVPLLPIPNRTVKRLSADDSADSRVKVGHRQANNLHGPSSQDEGLLLCVLESVAHIARALPVGGLGGRR